MKTIINYKAFLLGLLIASITLFSQSEYKVSKANYSGSYTMGELSSQNMRVFGTFGQAITTSGTEGNTMIKSGFWYGVQPAFITSVNNENELVPKQYTLSQNYPNPFNPSTNIKYSLPKASDVTIKIYDILGREVRTLVNKEQQPGNYVITFNSNKLASGTYIYRIIAGDFVQVKKMMLLK